MGSTRGNGPGPSESIEGCQPQTSTLGMSQTVLSPLHHHSLGEGVGTLVSTGPPVSRAFVGAFKPPSFTYILSAQHRHGLGPGCSGKSRSSPAPPYPELGCGLEGFTAGSGCLAAHSTGWESTGMAWRG